jgi:Coenzyme PQQ synthesis protein D (PqqD)
MNGGEMLDASVRVPEHVVYRAFPSETVLLNLNTGKYHGVNPTGGRMLDVLKEVGSIRHAAARLADEYEIPVGDVEQDLSDFCARLAERELIEVEVEATE